jgi:hypothetical protein
VRREGEGGGRREKGDGRREGGRTRRRGELIVCGEGR